MGHARRPQLYGDGARDYLCTQLFRRVHSGHRAHRRGLLQLCPLVDHLDRREFFGGGSTVGAWGGSGEHVRARSQEIWGHRAHPWFGWKGVSECKGERRHTTHAASYQPVRLERHAGGGAVRQGRQANEPARRTRGCEGRAGGLHCVHDRRRASSSREKVTTNICPRKRAPSCYCNTE